MTAQIQYLFSPPLVPLVLFLSFVLSDELVGVTVLKISSSVPEDPNLLWCEHGGHARGCWIKFQKVAKGRLAQDKSYQCPSVCLIFVF
jgi:hypothetical protein